MRSPVWRLRTVAAAVALTAFAAPAGANGAGVAYLDGGEVWVASLDGAQKVRLSAGEGNWETVAQSTTGFVVATRRADRALVTQTATFTIWNPDGTVKDVGPMAGKTAGDARETLPFGGLALSPDARGVIYGYSSFVSGADSGYFILPSATRARPVGGPLAIGEVHAPTLLGERVIGTPDGRSVSVQDTGGLASTTFTPWPGVSLVGVTIRDLEVSENARTLSLGVDSSGPAHRPSGSSCGRSQASVWRRRYCLAPSFPAIPAIASCRRPVTRRSRASAPTASAWRGATQAA